MKYRLFIKLFLFLMVTACKETKNVNLSANEHRNPYLGHWVGTIEGSPNSTFSFDVEGDAIKRIKYRGPWKCQNKIAFADINQQTDFPIELYKFSGWNEVGSPRFRFELEARFDGRVARGTIRILNLSELCETDTLRWKAQKE